MKAVSLLQTFQQQIDRDKKISKPVDIKMIGAILLTLDEWAATDPKSVVFHEIPVDEWKVPNWLAPVCQPQKVSIITNDRDIPNLLDREGYGKSMTIKVGNEDVEIAPCEEPADLLAYCRKLANYYGASIDQKSVVTLSSLTGDVSLTDVRVVRNVLIDGLIPLAWDRDIPITFRSSYSDMFGDEHTLVKYRPKEVVSKVIDLINS